jgi:predicted transcriptional regulator of viral defense system
LLGKKYQHILAFAGISNQVSFEKEKRAFSRSGGLLRTSAALRAGIHPRTLYDMRDEGVVEELSRGLYRLADLPALSNPDLVTVALKIPAGVVCLISALAYHEITTQIPHEVHVALQRGTEPPRLKHPPLRVFWFTGRSFTEGIETHKVDGIRLRVYSPEKTLADCFKYRNKLGLDTVLEALRLYRSRKRPNVDELMKFARVCRVEKVMRPYLEALL